MSFGRRLSRLAQATSGAEKSPACADGAQTAQQTPSDVLVELRAKMNEILTRPDVAREASPEPSTLSVVPRAEDAGMLEQQTQHGPLWSTQVRLSSAERVGRIALDGAALADQQQLALLALDTTLAEVDLSKALFFDTETTGLGGGAGTYAFLLGLGYFKQGRWWLEQLMLGGPEQEPALLERFRELLGEASCLVSFNGKSYDWPLLSGRYVLNRLPPIEPIPHLDLLHLTRRVHKHRLERCSLRHIEGSVLGFERIGDIDGAEVASRYTHFLRTGNTAGLIAVIEHNRWDVLSMIALVSLYGEKEPALLPQDFVGLARTLGKAKAWEPALNAASSAVDRGAGSAALRVRGEIHKALGDRVAALRDFEAAGKLCPDPGLRLELSKLYEHFMKQPEKALWLAEQGTTERAEPHERRIARLQHKLKRAK